MRFLLVSFYLFFESPENKFIDENSVLDKKKLLSLKCVISDTLIGSQRDKLPTLIGVCRCVFHNEKVSIKKMTLEKVKYMAKYGISL